MEKCFNFEVSVSEVKHGYVFAKDKAEALKLIKAGKWDEATPYDDSVEIIEVNTIFEDKVYA